MLGPALQFLIFPCSKQSAASVDFPQGEGGTDHRGTYSGSTSQFFTANFNSRVICQPLACLVKVHNTPCGKLFSNKARAFLLSQHHICSFITWPCYPFPQEEGSTTFPLDSWQAHNHRIKRTQQAGGDLLGWVMQP